MKLYITGMSIFVLGIFYLPLLLGVVWMVWRKTRYLSIARRTGAMFLVLVVGYLIPLGDVTVFSLAMHRACESAGVHIYQRVPVEGYLDDAAGMDVIQSDGYKFIENRKLEFKEEGHKVVDYIRFIHAEKKADGSTSKTLLDQPMAKFEVVREHSTVEAGVKKGRIRVRNIATKEVIGERVSIVPVAGWVDRAVVYRWFEGGSSGACERDDTTSTLSLIRDVIPPK